MREQLLEAIAIVLEDEHELFPGGFAQGTADDADPSAPYCVLSVIDTPTQVAEDTSAEINEQIIIMFHAYASASQALAGDKQTDRMVEKVLDLFVRARPMPTMEWDGGRVRSTRKMGHIGPEEDPDRDDEVGVVWHSAVGIEFFVVED